MHTFQHQRNALLHGALDDRLTGDVDQFRLLQIAIDQQCVTYCLDHGDPQDKVFHALNEDVCSTGSRRSGIIIRITCRSISVDWVRTISSRLAISVDIVLFPLAAVPPINNSSGSAAAGEVQPDEVAVGAIRADILLNTFMNQLCEVLRRDVRFVLL